MLNESNIQEKKRQLKIEIPMSMKVDFQPTLTSGECLRKLISQRFNAASRGSLKHTTGR